MNLVTLTLFLTLPLIGGPPRDGEAGDDVARVFDASSLSSAFGSPEVDAVGLTLLPLMRPLVANPNNADEETFSTIHEFAEIFLAEYGDDVERLDVFPNGQIYVQGTEEAVAQFSAYLAFFESIQTGGPRLDLIRFRAEAGSVGAEIERGALLARLGALEGEVTRETISVPFGGKTRVFDQQSTTVACGVYSEIAQSMAIHHAEISDVMTGFELVLATGPARDGLRVTYAVSELESLAGEPRKPVLAQVRLSSTERGLDIDDSVSWGEPVRVAGGSYAGELRLRPGFYVVLQIGSSDGVAEFIALGMEGGVPVAPTLETSKGSKLFAVCRGGLGRPELRVARPGSNRASSLSLSASAAMNFGDPLVYAEVAHSDREMFLSLLEGTEAVFLDVPGGMIVSCTKEQRPEVEPRLALTQGTRSPRLAVAVRARGGTDGPERRGSLVTASGSPTAIVIGQESLTAKRYNVEVAQSAAAREPVIETHFEGLAMTFTLSKLSSGRLAYAIRGQVSEDIDADEASANSLGGGGLLRYRSSHVGLNTTGTVAPGTDGGWTIHLGNTVDESGSVILEVTELK